MKNTNENQTPSSPCIQICEMDEAADLCIGCGRTRAEIVSWRTMSEHTRKTIMSALPKRLEAYKNHAHTSS